MNYHHRRSSGGWQVRYGVTSRSADSSMLSCSRRAASARRADQACGSRHDDPLVTRGGNGPRRMPRSRLGHSSTPLITPLTIAVISSSAWFTISTEMFSPHPLAEHPSGAASTPRDLASWFSMSEASGPACRFLIQQVAHFVLEMLMHPVRIHISHRAEFVNSTMRASTRHREEPRTNCWSTRSGLTPRTVPGGCRA